jgi:hypothetical protein
MNSKTLLNGIIDAVKDKSSMGCQTSLGKASSAGGKQNGKGIIFADLHRRLGRSLAIQKTTIAQIGDDNRVQEAQITR